MRIIYLKLKKRIFRTFLYFVMLGKRKNSVEKNNGEMPPPVNFVPIVPVRIVVRNKEFYNNYYARNYGVFGNMGKIAPCVLNMAKMDYTGMLLFKNLVATFDMFDLSNNHIFNQLKNDAAMMCKIKDIMKKIVQYSKNIVRREFQNFTIASCYRWLHNSLIDFYVFLSNSFNRLYRMRRFLNEIARFVPEEKFNNCVHDCERNCILSKVFEKMNNDNVCFVRRDGTLLINFSVPDDECMRRYVEDAMR